MLAPPDPPLVRSLAAESPKFTASLLLVHGLWCTAAVWQRFMGYSAHRGWDCEAVQLPGRGDASRPGEVEWADWLTTLESAMARLTAPPILIGHDVGALLALAGAARGARAVVAVAPVVPRVCGGPPVPAAIGLRARLAAWRGRALAPPAALLAAHYGATPPGGFTADSARVARSVAALTCEPPSPPVPGLVIAASGDQWVPIEAATRLAARLRLPLEVLPGSHALPWDSGWHQLVAVTHRWLVRTLGEPLLIPPHDEAWPHL